MKQLFFALLLVAIASSGYLKAIQSQDDAAREVAQVLKTESKREGVQALGRSFEQVAAAQVVASTTLVHSTVAATTTLPTPAAHTEDSNEAEVQLGELIQREPEIDKLFEGKSSLAYIAIRNIILISKYPGYIRNQSDVLSMANETMNARLQESLKALADLSQSMTPEQEREYGSYIEQLKNSFEAQNRAIEEDQHQSSQSNGEQP